MRRPHNRLLSPLCAGILALCAQTSVGAPLPLLDDLTVQEASHSEPGVTVERQLGMMGTLLRLSVEHDDRSVALAASEAAVQVLETTEARLSTWLEKSELSQLNRSPLGEPFAISADLHADLSAARKYWTLTHGAFDPAVGAAVQAWDIRNAGRIPTAEERRATIVADGFAALELSALEVEAADGAQGPWALRRSANLRIDEGGFGKGLGLDRAMAALRSAGAHSALLDLGGQVVVFGRSESIPLADPRDRSRAVLSITLNDGSLATSGNSERGVQVEGERIGHLFHARTGEPAPDFGSLTVIATSALAADALSTGLYVMGPAQALALAEKTPGIEVVILDTRQAHLRLFASSGMRDKLTHVDSTLIVEWKTETPTK